MPCLLTCLSALIIPFSLNDEYGDWESFHLSHAPPSTPHLC